MTMMMIIIILMILALVLPHTQTHITFTNFSLSVFRFRLIIFNKILFGLSSSTNTTCRHNITNACKKAKKKKNEAIEAFKHLVSFFCVEWRVVVVNPTKATIKQWWLVVKTVRKKLMWVKGNIFCVCLTNTQLTM